MRFDWASHAEMVLDGGAHPMPYALPPLHNCQGYFPGPLKDRNIDAATVMEFRISTGGSVEGLGVAQSSGNAGLDAAALSCAQNWRYLSAIQKGIAVEIPRTANVRWRKR